MSAHPEAEWTHRFRNAVLAYKLRAVLQAGEVRELTVVLGASHTPIEDDLRRSAADLLARIRSARDAVALTGPRTISAVCRMEFSAGRWRVAQQYDLGELKSLAGA